MIQLTVIILLEALPIITERVSLMPILVITAVNAAMTTVIVLLYFSGTVLQIMATVMVMTSDTVGVKLHMGMATVVVISEIIIAMLTIITACKI